MGAVQLVLCFCWCFGSLHNEQQETLASVYVGKLASNNSKPKSSLFQENYLHSTQHAWTWAGAVMVHILGTALLKLQ